MTSREIATFRKTVLDYWKKYGRHDLPWRNLPAGKQGHLDPYRILVSEVMLQQTQVQRVIPKYREFLREFPTVRALSLAPLSDVLRLWSGLGYNRRGKYLRDAAKEITAIGSMKKALEGPLLGVGPYTRAAVRIFAYNEPHTTIETNIRAVYLHHFFSSSQINDRVRNTVHDRELVPYIETAAQGQDPRQWHWALMDYGAFLKRSGVRLNARSAHYVKQTKFKGSQRHVRGAILRSLHRGPSTLTNLPFDRERVKGALAGLERDGLVRKRGRSWLIA